MGLDIYHNKATLDYPDEDLSEIKYCTILENDYEGFDVPFSYFEQYIQQVDVPIEIETLVLPKSEVGAKRALATLGKYNYTHLWWEQDPELQKELIFEFEKSQKLSNLPKGNINAPHWHLIIYYKLKRETGFYFEERGYQRKGMNSNFADRYYSKRITEYASLNEFEFAYNCVDFYWSKDTVEDIEEAKKNFYRSFIDNYELGRSWMSVSY